MIYDDTSTSDPNFNQKSVFVDSRTVAKGECTAASYSSQGDLLSASIIVRIQ